MFSLRSLGLGIPRWLTTASSSDQGISLPSVSIHDIEENPEKRARTLKHLIKANHINHSIIYHNLQFHNHTPHVLGSAFLLGATSEQLNTIYDAESKTLEPWHDSPGEISKEDWRDFLGKRAYQRAFVDFFEDRLVQHGYDWKDLLDVYLFEGERPLVNGLVCGLAHPLIHLGYGYELNSRTIAIEALAMTACFYNDLHKYLDKPRYIKPSPWSSPDPVEVLSKMAEDKRFESLISQQGDEDYESLMRDGDKEALMLEYWNSWTINDPKKQFEDGQRAAAGLLIGSVTKKSQQYDFFIVHLLTSSHAVRILLPLIPARWHLSLLRQWWLFVVSAYIMQLRPRFDLSRVTHCNLEGRGWKYVIDRAVNSRWSTDAHFVKGECRYMLPNMSWWLTMTS